MTRVIKIGGRVQNDPALIAALAFAQRAAIGGLVVVHGGGDEVSAMQRKLGMEPRFIGGRRVTTDEELEIVRMVLSGTTNKRLVAQCADAGLRAVGVSGEDGGLLLGHVADGSPLGRVGERVHADPALLRTLLADGWLPVVSPLAQDGDNKGVGLNVNGDDAAAAIAIALQASELLFVADVPGVLVDGAVVQSLAADDATALIERGLAAGGMAAKLEAGRAALSRGVARVRIAGLAALSDTACGTTLTLSLSHPQPKAAPWPQ